MTGIAFDHPHWLLAWPLLAGLGVLLDWFERKKARARAAWLGPRDVQALIGAPIAAARIRLALFVLSCALLCSALAEPWREVADFDRAGVAFDVAVVLDVSRSMRAEDLPPDRLARAQRAITELLQPWSQARCALVAFAGEALLRVPLTEDRASFAELLMGTDELSVGQGGTDLGQAIERASAAFARSGARAKIILLVTDGEDHGGRGQAAARAASEAGMVTFALGIGTRFGATIPDRSSNDGPVDVLRDDRGTPVVARPDFAALEALALAGGGLSRTLEDARGLTELGAAILRTARERSAETERGAGRERLYGWPLISALVLSTLAWTLSSTRRRP